MQDLERGRRNSSKEDTADRLDNVKLLAFRKEGISMNKRPLEGEKLSSLSCNFRMNTSYQPLETSDLQVKRGVFQVLSW